MNQLPSSDRPPTLKQGLGPRVYKVFWVQEFTHTLNLRVPCSFAKELSVSISDREPTPPVLPSPTNVTFRSGA